MAKRKQIEVKALKDQILTVALDVFSEFGYSKTNIRDIAERLGVTRTPIYYHFENKYEIYKLVSQIYLEKKKETFRKILSEETSFFVKIQRDLAACLEMAISEDVLFGELTGNPELEEVLKMRIETFDAIHEMKRNAVLQGKERGELRKDADVDRLLDYIYLQHFGFVSLRQCRWHTYTQEVIEGLIDTVVSDIRLNHGVNR